MDRSNCKRKINKSSISKSFEEFDIEVNSLIDEQNTYTKLGYYSRESEYFPLNIKLSISNNGPSPLKNPHVEINGSGNWRTIEDVISFIRNKYCPVSNKEKLLSVWRFFCENLTDSRGGLALSADPVVALNSLGYAGCYHLSLMMLTVYKYIGFEKVRLIQLGTLDHWLPEVWYNGKYHMVDSCLYVFFPDEQGEVAGIDDLQNNYKLAENIIHHNGPAGYDAEHRTYAQDYYKTFLLNDKINIVPQTLHKPMSMNYMLRPGETLVRCWNETEKFIKNSHRSNESHLTFKPRYGYFVYEQDYNKTSWLEGVDMHRNVVFNKDSKMLTPSVSWKKSEIIFKIVSPYAITGADIELDITKVGPQNNIGVDVLVDDLRWKDFGLEKWEPAYQASEIDIHCRCPVILDKFVCGDGTKLIFSYFVRIWMLRYDNGIVGIKGLKLKTDIQCATLSLPSLKCGKNRISYLDDSIQTPRDVEIIFEWQEDTEVDLPEIPQIHKPISMEHLPQSSPEFSWSVKAQGIIDYHIQVSEYADFRWVVSPNFDRYLSRTKFAGETRWTPLRAHELKHGNKYFWRIRAKNNLGIWGQWSIPIDFIIHK